MVSHWITYNGKRIFVADYRGMIAPQYREEMAEVVREITSQPLNSVLFLVDASQMVIGPEILQITIAGASKIPKFVQRTAVLGISGMRMKIMDIVVSAAGIKTVKAFMDKEESLKWLAA